MHLYDRPFGTKTLKQMLVGLLALLCLRVSAQQEQMYTQFMFNRLAYNPGYAGSFESPTLTAVYRNQWTGFDGAPNTQALSYSQPLLSNRVGIGANLVRNSIGITRTINIDVAYAYRVAFRRGYLCIGLQASMRHFYQDWSDPRLIAIKPIPTDEAIPTEPQSKLLPNFGVGVYYAGKKWYVGVAAPRMVSNNIDFADAGGELSREVQHYNAMGGVSFKLNSEAVLTPQLLLKYVKNAPLDADVNVSLMLFRKVYSGLTYRTGGDTNGLGESIDVLAGWQMNSNLFFCLSYDIGLTRLRKFQNGSLEATARWYFNPPEGTPERAPTNPNL